MEQKGGTVELVSCTYAVRYMFFTHRRSCVLHETSPMYKSTLFIFSNKKSTLFFFPLVFGDRGRDNREQPWRVGSLDAPFFHLPEATSKFQLCKLARITCKSHPSLGLRPSAQPILCTHVSLLMFAVGCWPWVPGSLWRESLQSFSSAHC
jgi:hypothetical protein